MYLPIMFRTPNHVTRQWENVLTAFYFSNKVISLIDVEV